MQPILFVSDDFEIKSHWIHDIQDRSIKYELMAKIIELKSLTEQSSKC